MEAFSLSVSRPSLARRVYFVNAMALSEFTGLLVGCERLFFWGSRQFRKKKTLKGELSIDQQTNKLTDLGRFSIQLLTLETGALHYILPYPLPLPPLPPILPFPLSHPFHHSGCYWCQIGKMETASCQAESRNQVNVLLSLFGQ